MRTRKTGAAIAILGVTLMLAGATLSAIARKGQESRQHQWAQSSVESPDTLGHAAPLTLMTFPRLKRDLLVVDGNAASDLLAGPARMTWSSLPGANGNCVIAAHRDTHFGFLKDVRMGDDVVLERGGKAVHYRITYLKVVSPQDKSYYGLSASPILTLVTCFPFHYVGRAPKRYIVRAQKWSGGV